MQEFSRYNIQYEFDVVTYLVLYKLQQLRN